MPSQFAELYQDHALPVLDEQLGEDVLWYPLGDVTRKDTIRAIFVEEEANEDRTRGKENVRKASCTVLDGTLPIDTRDKFRVNNQTWATRTVARGTDPFIVCELEIREPEVRNKAGGQLL